MTRTILAVLIGSLFSLLAWTQDMTGGYEIVHPYQRVEIRGLAATAAKDGEAASVAKTAISITLSGSKLKCAPESEVSSVIEANADAPLSTLASKLSGTSCASDGQILKMTATFTPNGAIKANDLVASIKQGQPLIVEWRHSLYVLYGVIYDEHLNSDGSQNNVIRELLLIDPRYSGKQRRITFVRGKDNFDDVAGTLSMLVK